MPISVSLNTVVAVTVTVIEPLVATLPMPLSILAESAFCDVQLSVSTPPPIGSVSGVAVNVPVGSGGL